MKTNRKPHSLISRQRTYQVRLSPTPGGFQGNPPTRGGLKGVVKTRKNKD